MNKMNVIVFASICAFSFCYILFLNNNNNNSRKKIDREIHEAIKKISEKSVVLKNDDNDDDGFITKKK